LPIFIDRGAPVRNALSPPNTADAALGFTVTPFAQLETGKVSQ
jgi:hypothetical protein